MQLIYVKNHKDQKEFLNLPKIIYLGDKNYRNLNEYIIRQLFIGKTTFCQDKVILPVLVKDNEITVGECFFIYTDLLEKTLQISFFEALENKQEAVDLMIEEAKKVAGKYNCNRIVIGLNGHVNYGLGFLCDHYDALPIFGTSYNKPYYIDYFRKYNLNVVMLNSYTWDMKLPKMDKYQNIIKRLDESFTIRTLDLKELKRDAAIYNDLNLKCFKNHRYYYPTSSDEDYIMLKELLMFTTKEFLLFAYDKDKPVGFLMWYPDFNQILKPGEKLGVKAYIKNKLYKHKINRVKVAEIAVLDDYKGKGVSLLLLKHAVTLAKQYKSGESSWILKENAASIGLTTSLVDEEYKHYVVFEMDLTNE